MEIVVSAIVGAVGNLVTKCASPSASYFFHFGKKVEDFRDRRNQLALKKVRVKNDVDEATRQGEVIETDVQDWLEKAEIELGEAQSLEDEIEGSKCFIWCPRGWRYCLSKRVAKKTLLFSKLLESSDFPRVSHPAPLQVIELLISDNFMSSQSSKAAFDKIMNALTSDDVDIIGLYGMPGVGKTTLATKVGKEAMEQKLFDKVLIVTVSHDPDINKIQDKIAEILGLTFKTKELKAEELWRKLKGEKNILIIVDDVWDRLELQHIGIPFGDGCKILLTTRSQQVCAQMNCQKKILLNILLEDEAWALFKYYASLEKASPTLTDVAKEAAKECKGLPLAIRTIGLDDWEVVNQLEKASPTLTDVAKEVAKECKGLPLAIRTIGTALKDETLDEWEVVNQRLKDSRHLENQDVCEGIYRSLKISYDYLKGNNSRLCLLLCSLFPEDYEIRIEELTVYGIGQGMFDDVNSLEDARREMRVIITNLQKFGLLLETSAVGTVKMHDVVRDFVHWMTLKGENDQNMFYVRGGLKKWPRQSLGCCTAISLINSEINNFPEGLEFPKLEVLLLDGKSVPPFFERARVPSMFFQGMKALKVLFLRDAILSLEGLQFLPNLRILRLECCDLENALCLGNLKNLEILIIAYSEIREPACYELMGFTTLRLLAISGNFSSKVFILPKYLLSSLVQLEELHLGLHTKWAISERSANKAGLSELNLLPRLAQLSLQVRSECIPKKFVFPPLQRYDVAVNDKLFSRCHWHGSPRRLTITKFSLDAFEELFCNVEELALRHITDLEYLIDTTKEQGSKSTFTNLVRLTLENMLCLKQLCHGLPPIGFLQKLETLAIKCCTNPVFEVATVQNLKKLTVEGCGQLQVIFQTDGVLLHANQEIQMPLVSV